MCRDDGDFVGDVKLFQNIRSSLHDREIAVAAHDNTDQWIHATKKVKSFKLRENEPEREKEWEESNISGTFRLRYTD